jgi:hypothetical protein
MIRSCSLAILSALLAAVEVSGPATPLPADALAEFTVLAPPESWCSLDPDRVPRLEIRGPDRRTWQRPAFWDGTRLRIRHTPRAAGNHIWRLLAPDGSEQAAGTFHAEAASGPQGPLRVAPFNRRLLAFADGTPFIPIGPNLAWAEAPTAIAFARWFRLLADQGCTHTRIWMCSWGLGLESAEPDRYRLDRAHELDGVLAEARAAGLRLTLVLDNHTDVTEGEPFPYGEGLEARQKAFFAVPPTAQWQRRIRYCLARWGADDTIAMWELMNEPDMAQPVREWALPWIEAGLATLATHDQDHRLRTVSWCGTDWMRAMALPGVDVAQVHTYVLEWQNAGAELLERGRDGVGLLLHAVGQHVPDDRPLLFGETGWQGTNDVNHGHQLDPEGLLLRQQAWAGLLAGGCGSAMNWWWDTYLEPRGLLTVYAPLAAAVRRIDWSDPGLAPLQPSGGAVRVIGWTSSTQGLLWPQEPSDTWHAHLVGGRERRGLSNGLAVRLDGLRSDTTFTVTGLDQLGGVDRTLGSITSLADGSAVLPLPAGAPDLVLLITLP